MSSQKINFPGLHALRFFAATLVIIHHVEQYKSWSGQTSAWGKSLIDGFGHASVSFFFVLSGFLITYLLLAERERKGSIDIMHFYWKRVIRIWPVYFLVVALVIGVIPLLSQTVFEARHFSFGLTEVALLVVFLPNLLRIRFPWLVGGNHLWSVGVEEQFYLFWPLLVSAFHRYIVRVLLLFIAAKAAVEVAIWSLPFEDLRLLQFQQVLHLIPFEQMAVGGLGAAIVFLEPLRKRYLPLFLNPIVRTVSFILLFWTFVMGWEGLYASYFEAVIFLVVILNVTFTKKLYEPLERPWLKKLGDVSYGIYMYHPLVIATVMLSLQPLRHAISWEIYNVLLYAGSIAGTLAVALLSYRWMERPILKLRNYFKRQLRREVPSSLSSVS